MMLSMKGMSIKLNKKVYLIMRHILYSGFILALASCSSMTRKEPLNSDLPILTLVTTDGQDPEDRELGNLHLSTIDSDWCMFVEPVLILE